MQWPWVVIFFLLLGKSVFSQTRIKRVINGEAFNGRPLAYKVIRYFGFLGTVHGIPWYTLGFWEHLKNWGAYGSNRCSGALLAPMMFQTACHCVAYFDHNLDTFEKPAVLANHWEKFLVVYVGVSNRFGEESALTYSPIKTERYLIHSRCAKLGESDAITHDYALIQIDSDFMKADRHTPYPWTEFQSAPHYTTQQIVDFHRYALQNLLVCMYLGFGYFERDSEYSSDVLRHGWGNLLSRTNCVEWTGRVQGMPWGRRDELINWVCIEKIPLRDQESGGGDSGSPVTCDNRYFAVLSTRTILHDLVTQRFHSTVIELHPLSRNLYVNSVNYRSKLLYVFYRLEQSWPRERSVEENPCNNADGCPVQLNLKLQDFRFPSSSRATHKHLSLAAYLLAIILRFREDSVTVIYMLAHLSGFL